jgi:hypothetical protein
MRVACLMMQKDERQFLEPWIAYHAWLFGIDNLYVFDNGSTDPRVLEILRRYTGKGLRVDYSRKTTKDFEGKGGIIAGKIRALDANAPYDFYFPLDCDEFVVALDGETPRAGKAEIETALAPLVGEPRVLDVGRALMNNPVMPDRYLLSSALRKSFFARGACLSLDLGFHDGRAITTDERVATSLAYAHFHYRSYRAHQFHGRQKLLGRVREMTRAELRRVQRLKLGGYHLVPKLLMSEAEYNAFLSQEPPVHFLELRRRLDELGAPILGDQELYADLPDIPEGVELLEPVYVPTRLRRVRMAVQRVIDVIRRKSRRD